MSQAKPKAKLNPEARLQASVARDVTIRIMETHQKHQRDALAAAMWEANTAKKDISVRLKRYEETVVNDSKVENQVYKEERARRLAKTFADDEIRYEEELSRKGLAYRRDRC